MQTEGRAPITSSRALRARRLFIIIATAIFAADLITKNWAESSLQFREPIRVIGDLLKFTYATNPGAAFNFATNATFVLTSLKLCVAAFIIYYMTKAVDSRWAIGLALLFGGVVGNLFDRATREPGNWQGEVVDWIQVPNWPVFNIADSAIVCAGIFMTILTMRNIAPLLNNRDDSEGGAA
ncbi:MAG: signal peptidase II [Actinomycetota bacterium]